MSFTPRVNPSGLLPWQPDAAENILRALRQYGGAADGSDMGTGKTYISGAVIRELNCPTLVVCPWVSITNWKRMGQSLGIEFDCQNYEKLRTGNTPFGHWDNPRPKQSKTYFKCLTCQRVVDPEDMIPCPYHYQGIHCIDTKKIPHRHGKFNWFPGIKLIVFDEVHRCSGFPTSLQANMLIAAKRQNILTIGLSATLADSPLGLRAFGYVLGLHSLIKRNEDTLGFFEWAMSKGCRKLPVGGWHFAVGKERQREIMKKIHEDIFPDRGSRVRISDLGDAFPKCQITAELYDLEKSGKINQLYAEMDEAIRAHRDRTKSEQENRPLTKMLRARQELELLKIPIFDELRADALAQGFHIVVFVNFIQTIEELCSRWKTNCRIDGNQTGESGQKIRQKNIDGFLEDKFPEIIVSADAGAESIGLSDLRGEFPRLGLVSPGFSAQKFRQICGRLPRSGSKSKSFYRVVLVSGTVEERIHKALSQKLDCLDLLNDGDLQSANLVLTSPEEGLY